MNPSHARTTSALALSALLGACSSRAVEPPQTIEQPDLATRQQVRNKVDLLFVIDNAPWMSAIQPELLSKLPAMVNVFDGLAHPTDGSAPQYVDLHIGVVTTDYGAGDVAGGGCDASPGGQRGLLQAVGAAADTSCRAPTGSAYIQYAFGESGDACNLPGGGCTTAALGQQLTCQASVGADGCGFDSPLEAAYAALTTENGTNVGFLRDDAVLAVVFVANDDDGSAPPSTDIFDPDPSKVAEYGAYTIYRKTHFGVACGSPEALTPEGASNGPLASCEAAPNEATNMLGQEYQVSRYIDLFTTPGSLKASPSTDIVLVGIDGPTTPFETILAATNTGNGSTTPPSTSASYVPCSTLGSDCIVALQHSCQNTAAPGFFADPPVRLDTVINAATLHASEPICGSDLTQPPDYTTALQDIATLIASSL